MAELDKITHIIITEQYERWYINIFLLADRTQVTMETYKRFNAKNQTSFLKPQGHTALVFGLWKWLMVLYIQCGIHAPGVKFGHARRVDNLHRLTTGKHSSINISKVSRWILCKLHTSSLDSRKCCILFVVRSDWNSGCHGNIIYVLMKKK